MYKKKINYPLNKWISWGVRRGEKVTSCVGYDTRQTTHSHWHVYNSIRIQLQFHNSFLNTHLSKFPIAVLVIKDSIRAYNIQFQLKMKKTISISKYLFKNMKINWLFRRVWCKWCSSQLHTNVTIPIMDCVEGTHNPTCTISGWMMLCEWW